MQDNIPLELADLPAVKTLVAAGHSLHLAQDQPVDPLLVTGT